MGRHRSSHHPIRIVAAIVGAVATLVVGLLVLVASASTAASGIDLTSQSGIQAVDGTALPTRSSSGAAGGMALPAIPISMLTLYRRAAATCPGLPWSVLAAIGTVESSNGTSTLPGVRSGANSAGAEGPMQFEPATFAEYGLPVPPGGAAPPSPYDPADAVFAASRMLCANGAATAVGLPNAVFAYNHSDAYVDLVLSVATEIQSAADLGTLRTERPPPRTVTPSATAAGSPGAGPTPERR